ncbi:MAG: hypothetical protein MJK04_12290 [Psychrosphaera sp.]|nr:hypothetical protein [Psychrosphaera sp.]
MSKFELTDDYMDKVEMQFRQWSSFLNNAMGLLGFTFGLACMGTQYPVINAWLSIAVLIMLRIDGAKFFPEEVKLLREAAKTDDKAKLVLAGFDKKYFGFKTMVTKYHLFTFGFVFLLFIGFANIVAVYWPWFGTYVGI